MSEFDPQAYLNSEATSPTASTTPGFDPTAYLASDQQPEKTKFDPAVYLAEPVKVVEDNTDVDNMLDRQNNPQAPVKKKEEKISALKEFEAFKPTKEDIESAITNFDTELQSYYDSNESYKKLKNNRVNSFGGALVKGPRPQKPIGANQKALSDYKRKLNDWENYENDSTSLIKETKLKRDTNPIFQYLKEAKIALGPEATKENVSELAKKNFIKAQESKIIQERVYAKVDEYMSENPGLAVQGKSQKSNVKKIKDEIGSVTKHQEANIGYLNKLGDVVIGLNDDIQALNEGFVNRDEEFKDISQESSEEVKDAYRSYLNDAMSYKYKFEDLVEKKEVAYNAYSNRFKTQTEILDPQFESDYNDLGTYLNHMDRNGHLFTGLGLTLAASGTGIVSSLEDNLAEIIMLPQVLENDKMLGDTRVAKTLVNFANQFEDWREVAYKQPTRDFIQSLRGSIQEPTKYDEIDGVGSAAEWAAFGIAEFLPQLGALYVAGPRGLTILSASASGASFDASRQSNKRGETNYSAGQRWVHAGASFGAEYLSESYTLGLIKGMKGIAKERVKKKFSEKIKDALNPKTLLPRGVDAVKRAGTAAYFATGEGFSEVGAKVMGENAADRFAFGKNVSMFQGVEEAFVTGVLMERTIAAPGIARSILQPFTGKEYTQQIGERETKKRDIEQQLENSKLSPEMKEKLEKDYMNLQKEQQDIIAKQAENVDMLNEQEVQDLIDLDVELNNIKQTEDLINSESSLTQEEKAKQISENQAKEKEVQDKKNEILAKAESPKTRKKRLDKFLKQEAEVKRKVAAYNKRQQDKNALAEAMGGKGKTGKVTTFETKEEQQAFFNNRNAEADAADRADIAEMQELLKNPDTSRADRITIQNNLKYLRDGLNKRSQESKSDSSSFGFISQSSNGSFEVFLNKENSIATNGNINVAAHEFLHATLYKTIGGNQDIQNKLGKAVGDYIVNKKGGFSEVFVNKMKPYTNAPNVGEEIITVMSESIMDGSLKFNDSFFTKIGDLIRQNLQRVGLKKIKFNTGKDVYNFIKDYNASIEKGYDSKAIDRLADAGAQGKLINKKGDQTVKLDTKTQYSKDAFQNEQIVNDLGLKDKSAEIVAKNKEIEAQIIKENIKDEKGNVKPSEAMSQALAKNNLPRAFALARQAANAANNLTLEDALKQNDVMEWFSEYSLKLTELSRTYRASKDGKKVPFGAYMNTLLPLKYSGILEKLKSKVETSSISDEATAKKVAKKTSKDESNKRQELEGVAVALDTMGHGDIMPKLRNVYSKNKNKVKRQKTYKDVKNAIVQAKKEGPYYQALVEVAEIFTNKNFTAEELAKRIRNKQDLTSEMRKVIQDKILAKSPEMMNMVPDGTSASGDAIGIANSKLGVWYNKQGRSKFSDTGTGKGLAVQQKQGLNTKTFLTPFGLGEKGKRVTNKSVDGALREWVTQISVLAMNQASRQADPKRVEIITTKEGKNPFQFSTSVVNDLVQVNSLFELEYNGKDRLLKHHKLSPTKRIKSIEDIDAYIDDVVLPMFKMGPKEMWFGPGGGTVFTSSAANLGLSASDKVQGPIWQEFVKRVKALKTTAEFGKPIKGINPKDMWTLRTRYDSYFKTPAKIKENLDNGNIADFNKKVGLIHREMWDRFNKSIKADRNSATMIASYLGFVANDTGHWHKLGAQFAGYSKEIKGKRYEYEHAMPATAAYLYLLDAALTDGVDFNSAYDLLIDNYKLIALDKAMDDKLRNARTKNGYSLQRRMPDNWDLLKDRWLDRYFNSIVMAQDGGINPDSLIALNGNTFTKEYSLSFSKSPKLNVFDKSSVVKSGIQFSKNLNNPTKGITVLDFDDTLATTKSLVKYTTIDGKTGTLNAEQYASTYEDLLQQGHTFDFSDFNKVVKGKLAPLFQKALKLQNKFGSENMFVLTARPPAAQQAIFDFLTANGLNIPLKNITGLANSTAEAKALWMADKAADGYNDFYFADDAIQNVQAVQNMLNQFDVKSKVQQAKVQFSKNMDATVNDIIEQNKGIKKESRFSEAEGRAQGIGKGKYKYWIPPGAEDFMGLLYTIASARGKKGDKQIQFFREALLVPYNAGINALNDAKQQLSEDYKTLLKSHPDVKKRLKENVAGTNFTVDHAIRVYLWNKSGFQIPGLAEGTKQKLLKAVETDVNLQVFANNLGIISKAKEGYVEPGTDWVAETIIADLANVTDKIGRAEFLKPFAEAADIIFSVENLNKIEAVYGRDYREALEDMIYRMKTGKNKSSGTSDRQVGRWTNWITNSVGAIMFLNMRSAVLQTISAVNFVNWSDNNPIKAAKAFANQKQFWSDFVMIFNSSYLKQRRSGLKTDVNEAQLANSLTGKKNKAKAAMAYLLKLGFKPTQIADSFAIASGGATFYRNRTNTYLKEGFSQKEAQEKAFADMKENANISQQSSDPSLISKQQASILGRFILAFQNTPMQYARITKKAAVDLIKGRGDWKTNVSKIVYYTFVQNLIFNALQQALFALAFGDDDEDEKIMEKNDGRLLNGMVDSVLRGTGIYGAVAATAKNVAIEFYKQDQKDGRADHAYTMLQFANVSPPIGSKLRKLYSSTQTRKFNKKEMKKMGYSIENPAVQSIAQAIEAFTNVPTGRAANKVKNISEALNEDNENWQRIALMMGWSTYEILEKKSKSKSKSKYSSKYSSKNKSKYKSKYSK